jgi:hypothetical protein
MARVHAPAVQRLEELMTDKYILDDEHNAIPEPDLLKWAEWFETFDRRVRSDVIGPYHVSTVFLGLDHSFSRGNPRARPLLFETMVFNVIGGGREAVDIQERCSTWREAIEQHERIAAEIRQAAMN